MMHKPNVLAASILFIASCVAVVGQAPAPTPKTSDEPRLGAIDGKVVNENGQPLAGASLFVRAVNSPSSGRMTISDLEGSFRVTGLDPGLYTVTATAPAYTSGSDPAAPTYHRLGDTARVELIRGGAITGMVTNSSGEPVIGVGVRAVMIRDATGLPKTPSFAPLEQQTDDRGIYRIYGLAPGTYLVNAGGGGLFAPSFNAYDTDAPTYAPSSTRDNAAEVSVRSGEDTNVDIRYRGEPGHSISGTVKVSSAAASASINVTAAGSAIPAASSFQLPGSRGFIFNGLADGDYDVVAQEVLANPTSGTSSLAFSEKKRVTVKGADVTGIELLPRPTASISGRILLESSKVPECQGKRPPLFAETLIRLQRVEEKETDKDDSFALRRLSIAASPDTSGAFVMRNLSAGKYQFEPLFYARYWYLRSITMNAARGKPQTLDAAANWTLRVGDQLSNLAITLTEGAASIRGSVPVTDGVPLPATVYLIPSEQDKAADVLRFFVTSIAGDGTFAFNNIPPGRYLTLTQATADAQTTKLAKLRQPEAAAARTKLRRTAETKKTEIELKPCQNLTDYQLKQ